MTTATTTPKASKNSAPLGVTLNGKPLFATPTGVKIGPRGKVTPDAEIFGVLDKGARRKVRKALRAAGFGERASQKYPADGGTDRRADRMWA